MSGLVLVDTSGLVALSQARDEHFHVAREWYDLLVDGGTTALVSHWVITEYLAMFSARGVRTPAVAVIDRMLTVPTIRLLPLIESDYNAGLARFRARTDKGWSLTDCISMSQCERLGVSRVLTADRHFSQAGFVALLREPPTRRGLR